MAYLDELKEMQYALPPLHAFVPMFIARARNAGDKGTDEELRKAAADEWQRARTLTVYSNDKYVIEINKKPRHGFTGMILWCLTIRRQDQGRLKDLSVVQEIKRRLCGQDVDAVIVFPGIDRDPPDNMIQLWAFMELKTSKQRPLLQFGFHLDAKGRRVS